MSPEKVHILPVQIRPRAGEGSQSFIARLARANHLTPRYLRIYLAEPPRHRGLPSWTRLAAATGRDAAVLQSTLETTRCLECGTGMEPTDVVGRRALRCSQSCRRQAYRRRHPSTAWRRVPCRICGDLMSVRAGQRRFLCSSTCRQKAYSLRNSKRVPEGAGAPLDPVQMKS
ncbi:TniQ family protein [Streptomyces sp. 6-11-2]|uniref:TniQ family protein n=1 Tax=Streptomyces sp. 6-11-2 TaxID=2585753 RepID=UPI00114274E2|nr:hypothetical protein TNCT6_53310 [Streptomyces sp. 6-11-2]